MRRALRLFVFACLTTAALSAQELEPRAYSNAPVGLRFVVVAAGYVTGDLVFDPTVPIADADASVSVLAVGYATTLGVLGKTSRLTVVVPFGDGSAQGYVNDEYRIRNLSGLGDTKLGMSWLFYGAPAKTAAEFLSGPRSPTVAGASVVVGIPTGEYDEARLINLGTNRYSVKTELGITHRLEKWSIEGAAAATFFTDNDEWFGGGTRTQDPIYSMQAHLVREFKPRLWAALDLTYYWGGQAEVNGVPSGVELGNSRTGITFSFPVGKTQSLKLTAASGISTRTGTDFDSYGLGWQWAIPPKR